MIKQLRQAVRQLERSFSEGARQQWKDQSAHLEALGGRLQLLSPENVLSRGYSITTDVTTGKILRSARNTKAGQKIQTRLKSGTIRSIVERE